jgi:hypothetical protein
VRLLLLLSLAAGCGKDCPPPRVTHKGPQWHCLAQFPEECYDQCPGLSECVLKPVAWCGQRHDLVECFASDDVCLVLGFNCTLQAPKNKRVPSKEDPDEYELPTVTY